MTPRRLTTLSRVHVALNSDKAGEGAAPARRRGGAERGTAADLAMLSNMPVR